MINDSRYEAGTWADRNIRNGDTIGYFDASQPLPRRSAQTVVTKADDLFASAPQPMSAVPMFLFVIPRQLNESVHERSMSDSTFARLLDGSLGYQQVLAIQTAALWPRPMRVSPQVNPPVRVFARQDIVPRLLDPPRIVLPDPY